MNPIYIDNNFLFFLHDKVKLFIYKITIKC